MCLSKALTFARTLAVASISPLAARRMLSFKATLSSRVGELVEGIGDSSPRCDAGLGGSWGGQTRIICTSVRTDALECD